MSWSRVPTTVALPLCRDDTLVPDGGAFIYLWADDTRISSGGQALVDGESVLQAGIGAPPDQCVRGGEIGGQRDAGSGVQNLSLFSSFV